MLATATKFISAAVPPFRLGYAVSVFGQAEPVLGHSNSAIGQAEPVLGHSNSAIGQAEPVPINQVRTQIQLNPHAFAFMGFRWTLVRARGDIFSGRVPYFGFMPLSLIFQKCGLYG